MLAQSQEQLSCITVICDDIDVMLLLIYYYDLLQLSLILFMQSTNQSHALINIGDAVIKHTSVIRELLAAHCLTGCDTTATYYGVGNMKMLKVLETKKFPLQKLGDPKASIASVVREATCFVAACYGVKIDVSESMSNVRYKIWISKTGRRNDITKNAKI